jgi:pathogenesis-related protein 1
MRSIPTLALFVTDALLCATLLVGVNSTRGESGGGDEAKPAGSTTAKLPASRVSAAEGEALVAFHNEARREVGAPPVAWSAEVASFAQQWADHIAATGKFDHRPYAMEKSETEAVDAADELPKQIYGENLAIGSGEFGAVDGARGWYAEKKDYVPGTPIPTDLAQFKAGHYTQLVWTKTKKIGAGKAIVQTGEFKGWTVIVCNYDPSGNWEGNVPFEVRKSE